MCGRCQFGKTAVCDFLDIIDSWKLVGWGKMGFKAQTCWTELLAFWGVWNRSRILNFGPDRLFFQFSGALIQTLLWHDWKIVGGDIKLHQEKYFILKQKFLSIWNRSRVSSKFLLFCLYFLLFVVLLNFCCLFPLTYFNCTLWASFQFQRNTWINIMALEFYPNIQR